MARPVCRRYKQAVQEFFGQEARRDVNPDEAVAMGAAIQGGVLGGDVKDVLLLDVTPLTLGIETMGGVRTSLIDKNTTIPTNASQTFSTAEDNQSAVTIHVLQGEREMAAGNKSLGRFDLTELPQAPRGTPQIEVSFDIDANGIMHVSAKDKATGKENKIVIKSSSGLSDAEIEAMIADAEAHAEEDAKARALVDARNQAESMVNGVKKTMTDAGESLDEAEKNSIEAAIAEVEEAVKADDVDDINAKVESLMQASHKLAEQMYAQAQEGETAETESAAQDENVVDAEFEEVKDEDEADKTKDA